MVSLRQLLVMVLLVACSTLTQSRCQAGHASNVPPGDELEILDPNANPRARPAAELYYDECGDLQVEVPPVVLVHKMYYSGNRTFQAQLLSGGPTLVVVNHPKSGERCYLLAQLPSGAPKITYTPHNIKYDFGHRSVCIHFPILGQPTVVYQNGIPVKKTVVNSAVKVHEGASHLVHATGIPAGVVKVGTATGSLAQKAAYFVHDAGQAALAPAKAICSMTPLAGLVTPDPAQASERRRDRELRQVSKANALDDLTFRTVR